MKSGRGKGARRLVLVGVGAYDGSTGDGDTTDDASVLDVSRGAPAVRAIFSQSVGVKAWRPRCDLWCWFKSN